MLMRRGACVGRVVGAVDCDVSLFPSDNDDADKVTVGLLGSDWAGLAVLNQKYIMYFHSIRVSHLIVE